MTAYEMRISDWSSDVCSSDLVIYNLPKATIKGIEAEFIARPFGGLSINGNVGLLWTKLDAPGVFVAGLPVDNQPLALTPKFTGKGGARYDFETSGLGTISPWVQFSYRTATHNSVARTLLNRIDGYMLIDADRKSTRLNSSH